MCQIRLNDHEAKQKKLPTKWYPKHYSKDIRKLLDPSPLKSNVRRFMTEEERFLSSSPCMKENTDFSHIPDAINT